MGKALVIRSIPTDAEVSQMTKYSQKCRRIVVGSLIGSFALIGLGIGQGVAQAEGEPGLPAPTLPEPNPTAPPLPGGGG